MSRTLSVRRFCERLRVITFEMKGSIFRMQSSVNLFLMNLTVLILVPGINSHICKMIVSPS